MDTQVILLVDDDPINNMIIQRMFARQSDRIRMQIFEQGQDGLSYLKSGRNPALILLDINMNDINAWEFLEQMQADKIDTPVMILTSSIGQKDMKRAKGYNQVIDYLIKPLDDQQVKKILDNLP
jgi:CheY-like chemotaxis protein